MLDYHNPDVEVLYPYYLTSDVLEGSGTNVTVVPENNTQVIIGVTGLNVHLSMLRFFVKGADAIVVTFTEEEDPLGVTFYNGNST